ncbi:MAG: hypothetical protein ACOYBJ_00180 [Patescibacteria group bacterium]|jgi:methionine--tRNA ligase beta chain
MITYDDFAKLEIQIGTITAAEKVEGADKLLKLTVDFGSETRQIVSGIAKWYAPEALVGTQSPFLINLEPRTIRGIESQGMILATGLDDRAVLLRPTEPVPSGAEVR